MSHSQMVREDEEITHDSIVSVLSSIPDLAIHHGEILPVPILFKFRSGTSLGWKERVDKELSDVGFMEALQRAVVLKAIIYLWCLYNYRNLFDLCHLVRRWCFATHTFFLSCGELILTLEDLENQLFLPILGGTIPSNIQLFAKEKAVEAELRKGLSRGNMKLSNWIGAFSEASTTIRCAFFIVF